MTEDQVRVLFELLDNTLLDALDLLDNDAGKTRRHEKMGLTVLFLNFY